MLTSEHALIDVIAAYLSGADYNLEPTRIGDLCEYTWGRDRRCFKIGSRWNRSRRNPTYFFAVIAMNDPHAGPFGYDLPGNDNECIVYRWGMYTKELVWLATVDMADPESLAAILMVVQEENVRYKNNACWVD